jgi:hypothetical protein
VGRTFWTWTRHVLLGLIALVLVLAGTGFVYRAYRLRRVAIATSIDCVKGIDEERFVKIGGIDQWITVRGHDRDNSGGAAPAWAGRASPRTRLGRCSSSG